MKKKPITTFLKVMSVVMMILSVIGALINGVAVFLAPLAGDVMGEPVDNIVMISIVISLICLIINFILAVLALRHNKLDLVYRISIFTLMFTVVFNSVQANGVSGYLSILASAAIQLLFCFAVFRQYKIDQG